MIVPLVGVDFPIVFVGAVLQNRHAWYLLLAMLTAASYQREFCSASYSLPLSFPLD